ncbi:hypothetical protein HTZ84_12945 [Haloterrigena sp. SYSU A558-1]|uniref:DUF7312 domain-containing protein n=1 Tax=Haloterrigena gelatinilytica TaxID=2741724 RepID=A0A8J8GJZ0_9EURY|nr:hypothetical protein [Haloterrigena gelatinilytica]NUB90976.1 hypothetical protein [Haloterrigena gelatinilytica]NUC73206.1 hypothetical protein [Haloterrigena gelatinilytica]
MADDAAGADGDDGERRGSSAADPDATDSIDDRQTVDDRDSWDRGDRRERADDSAVDRRGDGFDGPSRDDEYRVPLDLSGDADAAAEAEADADEDGDDPYAPEPNSTPIEPGDPDLESAIFVVLGAVAMTLVLLRVMTLPL